MRLPRLSCRREHLAQARAQRPATAHQALPGVAGDHTINAAYQYSEEGTTCSIELGKLTDLVILDKNPLRVKPMAIKDIKVVETIKEGVTIYPAK